MPAADLRRVRELFDVVEDLATCERGRFLAECDEPTRVRDMLAELAAVHGCASTSFGSSPAMDQRQTAPQTFLENGSVLGDFSLIRMLGRGAAGVVYLARQTSLGRLAALKVTRDVGHEASAMARLEHRHIVQVYSEAIDSTANRRLICMQYVPGPTLASVLESLRDGPTASLSGAAILAAIDRLGGGDVPLDPTSLSDRQRLSNSTYTAAVCWIVARLADGLYFAHRQGVLHHDIKPGNILIDSSGRPYIADFGLSTLRATQGAANERDVLGGTLAYMAPEHLKALVSGSLEDVGEHSDIYSLGMVLCEMLALQTPNEHAAPSLGWVGPPVASSALTPQPRGLDSDASEGLYALRQLTAQCLANDPAARPSSAGEMAKALDGCHALIQGRSRLPDSPTVITFARRFPAAAAILVASAGFLPHVLGNVLNPAYNALILFPRFSHEHKVAIVAIAAVYGAIVFPVQAIVVTRRFLKPSLTWWRRRTGRLRAYDDVDDARRQLLKSPTVAARLSLLGWLPLLAFVPLGCCVTGVGLHWSDVAHFAASVLVSVLILTPYTWFLLQYPIVRFAYVDLWASAVSYSSKAKQELAPIRRNLRNFQLTAGIAPLLAATVLLAVGPEPFATENFRTLRALAVCLIVCAIMGMWLAIHLGRLIQESIEALTGIEPSGASVDSSRPAAAFVRRPSPPRC